jgi:transcriptional regulator with XRE-family HTH domain
MRPVNGAAVKALRKAYGWKGVKFAAAIGVTHGHLSNIENGVRSSASAELARKIADALGVPLAAITSDYAVEDITDETPTVAATQAAA